MEHGAQDLEGMIEFEEPFEQNPEEEGLFEGQYGIEFEDPYHFALEHQEIENAIHELREAAFEDRYDVNLELLEVHEAVKEVQDSAEAQEPEITNLTVDK